MDYNLEQMVSMFVKEESIEEVVIGNVVIMLFLYVDDIVFFCKYFRRCAKAYKGIGKELHAHYI